MTIEQLIAEHEIDIFWLKAFVRITSHRPDFKIRDKAHNGTPEDKLRALREAIAEVTPND